jgi:hypothetical protein
VPFDVNHRPRAATMVIGRDWSIAGEAIFAVSEDGALLTATNSGVDAQLRPFQPQTVWNRQA